MNKTYIYFFFRQIILYINILPEPLPPWKLTMYYSLIIFDRLPQVTKWEFQYILKFHVNSSESSFIKHKLGLITIYQQGIAIKNSASHYKWNILLKWKSLSVSYNSKVKFCLKISLDNHETSASTCSLGGTPSSNKKTWIVQVLTESTGSIKIFATRTISTWTSTYLLLAKRYSMKVQAHSVCFTLWVEKVFGTSLTVRFKKNCNSYPSWKQRDLRKSFMEV